MKANLADTASKPVLTIRIHLTDGLVSAFSLTDAADAERLWNRVDPSRLFVPGRLIIGSENSKSVFVTGEIRRVDFIQNNFACWDFPAGYSDVVELSEAEFQNHVRLDQPAQMVKREQLTPVGDLLVSFVKLQLRGGPPMYVMIEFPVKLPIENQSFMRFLLAKGSVHMRLRSGGIGVINLANLVAYTVYPGVAQIPEDAWLAEPISS